MRLRQYGENIIAEKKKKSLIIALLEEFKDLMVIILIVAAGIAALAGETRDASVIFSIVVLNAVIGFFQQYKAEKALEALKKMLAPQAKVLRNGKIESISAKWLVPGDIILLGEGDSIPADAQILEENELQVNESVLTGESAPVEKTLSSSEQKNILFMGTSVTHGTAKAIVIQTGMSTEFGKIAHLTETTEKDKSPLQKELFRIGIFVGKVTLVISAILFVTGWWWQGRELVESFLFATSVAVAAVPEGLPATITIALAIGVQRLARKKSIVKKLASVETLGSTTVICSDKTGTLTKNEMTVVAAYMDGKKIAITEGAWSLETKSLAVLCAAAVCCNNAEYSKNSRNRWRMLGDPTEGSLLVAAQKTSMGLKPIQNQFKRLKEFPFDSVRKMMSTIDFNKKNHQTVLHMKGAPQEVLERCTHGYENGKKVKLTAAKRREILSANDAMANRALRVLAFAERSLGTAAQSPNTDKTYKKEEVEKELVFIGLMGMIDPPRPEVYRAVKMAHAAGIRIIVVTGDYGPTALAIARELKIVTEKKVTTLTGAELKTISETKLRQLFKDRDRQIIFARVSPEHKLKIVKALKANGEIVAMTGDGVNDAPALKKADIGVAMGITGTDVSKEAADMILVDDSFGNIVNAIEEGRIIYNNLKKFVFYIFSCNIGELITVFSAILLQMPPPLTAILILCVNLGTDVLPALALSVDPPEPGIMTKAPRSQKEPIMKRHFIAHFLFIGLCIGAIVMATFFWMLNRYGWQWGTPLASGSLTYLKASSSALVILVLIQMANAFNVRSANFSLFKIGITTNRWLFGAIALSLITVYAFVELPFFQHYLGTTSLTLHEWLVLIGGSLVIIVIEEIRKAAFVVKINNHNEMSSHSVF